MSPMIAWQCARWRGCSNPAGGWSGIANPGTFYQAVPTANNLPPVTATGTAATAGLLSAGKPDPGCATFGVVHRYGDDPDVYLVIGEVAAATQTVSMARTA